MTEVVQQQAPVLSIEMIIAEVNLVLGALSNLPYRAVGDLITKIKGQGESQFNPEGDDKQSVTLQLDVIEANACLGALAELPYKLVADTLHKIKAQGDQQFAALQAEQPAAEAPEAPIAGEQPLAAETPAAPVLN